MKLVLLPFFAALIFPFPVKGNLLDKKDITFQEIEAECKNADSKYFEYKKIGMKQFAKNYLKLCMEKKVNYVLQSKYDKCLKKNKLDYCHSIIRKWLSKSN